MKKKINFKKIGLGFLTIIILAAFVSRINNNKQLATDKVYHHDANQAVLVETETINLGYLNLESAYIGTFEANKESKISAEVAAKINSVFVDLGSSVAAGQSLIALDHSLLSLQVQKIDLEIKALQDDVNRFTALVQADAIQGIQLEKAQTALNTAKVQRATLTEQIAKSTIKASFPGVITAKLSEAGSFAAPGMPLLELTDISRVKLTIWVAENDLKHFDSERSYPIQVDAYPDLAIEASVSMIGSKSNQGNSFPVQFKLKNTPDLKIKAGMFGRVLLNTPQQIQGISIPTSAIQTDDGQHKVYVVKNGKAHLQKVEIGNTLGNRTQILSGLNEKDVLIIKGFINLVDGVTVNISK